jgi:hypothetical protein
LEFFVGREDWGAQKSNSLRPDGYARNHFAVRAAPIGYSSPSLRQDAPIRPSIRGTASKTVAKCDCKGRPASTSRGVMFYTSFAGSEPIPKLILFQDLG